MFFHFVQTATYLLFICVGDCFFWGGGFSSLFHEQAYSYRHDSPVFCGCVFSTARVVTIHQVLDDVAATHTTPVRVYIATRGRKEVD